MERDKNRTVWLAEVGVLMTDKNDPSFKTYSKAYDGKYGYYDENQVYFPEEQAAMNYVRDYVANGVEKTYGVVSVTCIPESSIGNDNVSELPVEDESYDVKDVVFCLAKIDGNVRVNFIEGVEPYAFDACKAADKCVAWIRDWFAENGPGCNAVIGISGGKDSTVVAALCARALGPDRVIGIMMPNVKQDDIEDSRAIIKSLGIKGYTFNIGNAYTAMMAEMISRITTEPSRQSEENLSPRLRMSALYLIAQSMNGRVSNNCNASENYIGYSTIYGDTAGDFSPISGFTVSEVIAIGRVLGIPEQYLVKPPSDGLCGRTDEDKIGFTYETLDNYIRFGRLPDEITRRKIDIMHRNNRFKHEPMAAFKWECLTPYVSRSIHVPFREKEGLR